MSWTETVEHAISTMMYIGIVDELPAIANRFDVVICHDREYIWNNRWEELYEVRDLKSEVEDVVPTNCCNCGAPLGGDRLCKYCGTKNILRESGRS